MEAAETNIRMSPEVLERTLSTIEIPPCPAVVAKVMGEVRKDLPDLNTLAKIIAADVGMAALAIKLANSPMFSAGGGTRTVPQAVARLGTRNVVCVVVAVALKSAMTGVPSAFLERFWSRASTVAIGAGMIAKRLYRISPDEAYSFGLFHDAAIPVLMRRFPNYLEVVAEAGRNGIGLAAAEMSHFSCNHGIVGGLLARNWGLSPLVTQAIRFHHEPDLYSLPAETVSTEALSLIAVGQVAESLDGEMHGEMGIEDGAAFEQARNYLGISDSDLSDLRDDLAEALNEVGR